VSQLSSLSVVFPAYNDAGTIASMVVVAMATARSLTPDYEVVVVNDSSRDHTGQVLAELERIYPDRLRVITHAKNRGYGGAIRSGFGNATKEWIFYTDGDAQYDPREIADLAAQVDAATDMVNGYKITRQDPFHRVIVGEIYRIGVKFLFGLGIRDVDCDFRLMHRSIFDHVDLVSTSGTITLELVKKIESAGFRIREVPVHHFFRAYGTSQFFNFRRVGRTLVDLMAWWWRLVGRPALHGGAIPGVTPATPATRAAAAMRHAAEPAPLTTRPAGPAAVPPASPPVAST
jgi:glycosyltransferase involved in cell wall biosynthesis